MQVAEERGAKILFNSQVVSIDVEKPAVELKDGTILEADLIIGADGKGCRIKLLANRLLLGTISY